MKKKIFTLLTLGVMLSFVCGTVNAQGPASLGAASVNYDVYSNASYWPDATDYTTDGSGWDAYRADNLYVGCEYVLTINLDLTAVLATMEWIYPSVPRSVKTTLPDSIPISLFTDDPDAHGTVKIPFTITAYDPVNLQERDLWQSRSATGDWDYKFSFYSKDATTGVFSGRPSLGPNQYTTYNIVVPPVYTFTHVTTYPDVWHIYVHRVSGNGSNTLFSLDGGITWQELKPLTNGVYEFTERELENMKNYVIFKEPNSCYWTSAYIFGEDYPEPPNPHSRLIIMNSFTNFTTSKVPGVHYVTSQRDFEFYVTANGDIPGTHLTVVVDPEKYPDGLTVPVETEYLGNGTWFVSIKRVTTTLNIIDFLVTVGNEAIAGTSVWAEGGQVFINAVDAGSASIFSAAGALVQNVTFASGETAAVALPAGFYVAVINGKAFKFIIK